MKIGNIIERARKTIQISSAEEKKLKSIFRNSEFDGYIISSRKEIVAAAKKDPRCYILQHEKLSKEVDDKSRIYGVFFGLGDTKILIFSCKI